MLSQIESTPSLRRGLKLIWLARCEGEQGHSQRAEHNLRQALHEIAALPPTRELRDLEGTIRSELGDVFTDRGDLTNAAAEHEAGVKISEELGDERGVAVGKGQLGTIYLLRNELARAAKSFHDAIVTFQRLREPASVAVSYHQLGATYHQAGDVAAAERAYRESARIKDELGDRLGAARSWTGLAMVVTAQGRPVADVEPWYRKALAVFKDEGDLLVMYRTLNNLANLLQTDPKRLAEARDIASQALALKQTLDPGQAEIWKIYSVLANIAEKQGDTEAARTYRAEARQSHAAAPIAQEALQRHRPLIGAMLATVNQPAHRPALDQLLAQRAANGWGNLVTALRAILDGQRNEDTLYEPLDREDTLIVHTILHFLANPEAARAFLSDEQQ
jgi:tetratricopeptide (TPR) repeat protein